MHNCIYGFFILCEIIVWIYSFVSYSISLFRWMKNLFLKQMILQFASFFSVSLHDRWLLCASFHSRSNGFQLLKWMPIDFNCNDEWWTIIIIIILLFLLALSQFIDTFNFETFQQRRRWRRRASSFIWISIDLFRIIRQVSNTIRFDPKQKHIFPFKIQMSVSSRNASRINQHVASKMVHTVAMKAFLWFVRYLNR